MTSVWIIVNNLASKREAFVIWGVADSETAAAELIRRRFQSMEVTWEEPTCETDDYLWSLTGTIRNTMSYNNKWGLSP